MTPAIETVVDLDRLSCGSTYVRRLGFFVKVVAEQCEHLTELLSRQLGRNVLCVAAWRSDGHPEHHATGLAAVATVHSTRSPVLEYPMGARHWAGPESKEVPWHRCKRLDLGRRQSAPKHWASYVFTSQVRPLGSDHKGRAPLSDPVLRRLWRPFEVFIEARL